MFAKHANISLCEPHVPEVGSGSEVTVVSCILLS